MYILALIVLVLILIAIFVFIICMGASASNCENVEVLKSDNDSLDGHVEFPVVISEKSVTSSVNFNGLGMFNLSVAKTIDGYSGVIRASTWNACHNQNKHPIYSYPFGIKIDETGSIQQLQLINLDYDSMQNCTDISHKPSINGIEDPRLFIYKDEEWIVSNCLGSAEQKYPCINSMCIFKVSDARNTFRLLVPPQPVDSRQTQKNWSPFEYNGALFCEYSLHPHDIFQIDIESGSVQRAYSTGKNETDIKHGHSLRGGAPPILITIPTKIIEKILDKNSMCISDVTDVSDKIPIEEITVNEIPLEEICDQDSDEKLQIVYLGIGHTRINNNYLHFFYIFESQPPFSILKVSKYFKLDSTETIQFAAGLSIHNNIIYVSYGVNDCYNRISRYKLTDIYQILTKKLLI